MSSKAVFFDYGGTLGYMDPTPEVVWLRLLNELDLCVPSENIERALQAAYERVSSVELYHYHGRMKEY